MVIQTTKEINGVVYDCAYSNAGMKIIRGGVEYDEAIDPKGSGRMYAESDTPRAESEDATDEDYRSALSEFGVKV